MTWDVRDVHQARSREPSLIDELPDKVPTEALADRAELFYVAVGSGRRTADVPMWLRHEYAVAGLVSDQEWERWGRLVRRGMVEL